METELENLIREKIEIHLKMIFRFESSLLEENKLSKEQTINDEISYMYGYCAGLNDVLNKFSLTSK